MSTDQHPHDDTAPTADPAQTERLHAAWRTPTGWRYWSSVNNTEVGRWYTGTAIAFFLFAGLLALLMRLQLAVPDNTLLSATTYNQLFTLHGSVMMFLFAVPIFEAFSILVLPPLLGARDLPFPRLSAYGFWCFLIGGVFVCGSIFFDAAPQGGWFMYPPLTTEYQDGLGPDIWLLGLSFIEIASIAAAVELIVGVLKMRPPGIALGGFLFVSAGLMPIAASEGHWPATQWFLHYVMRRSVSTSTLGVETPPLDDPALVLKGAGHYATNCLPCHGAPGRPRPQLALQMVPAPPYLPDKVDDLSPEGLFWVVKHGIKYTAMPAWVAQDRDDEVWAMVAFLQRLSELDARQFETLAYGERAGMRDTGTGLMPLEPPQSSALANCARCHGSDGAGRGNGAFPRLAGQREDYLRASLQAYATGDRHSGIMQPVSAELRPREIERLARHFAAQDAVAPEVEGPVDAASIARGRELAFRGDPERRLPSCVECHGPGDAERNPMYPELVGRYAEYLALQLRLFKADRRGGTGYTPVMREIAGRLEE